MYKDLPFPDLKDNTHVSLLQYVFTPKYRKKVLYGLIRRELKDLFHRLARQKECIIEEGHLIPDHVHMLISIPPKHSVSQV